MCESTHRGLLWVTIGCRGLKSNTNLKGDGVWCQIVDLSLIRAFLLSSVIVYGWDGKIQTCPNTFLFPPLYQPSISILRQRARDSLLGLLLQSALPGSHNLIFMYGEVSSD